MYYYNPSNESFYSFSFGGVSGKRGTAQCSHYLTLCSKASQLSV